MQFPEAADLSGHRGSDDAVGETGRSSLQTYLELRPSYDPEKIYAEGAAKVVWVEYAKEKSVPLPDSIRKLIGI